MKNLSLLDQDERDEKGLNLVKQSFYDRREGITPRDWFNLMLYEEYQRF
jgi:hypothetical protein